MGQSRSILEERCYDVSGFHVKVFVIGYGCFGESTLVLFLDGGVVFFSIVIDCYHYKEDRANFTLLINKTADILDDYHVGRLDVLCWTHPHDDHSKGFPRLISKYCDGATRVVFPMYVQDNKADIVKYGVVSKCNLDFIFQKNKEHKALAHPIGVADFRENVIEEFQVNEIFSSDELAHVRISAITPISSRLSEYVNDSLCSDPNELSISVVLDINGYGFFFGGDTKNNHIELARHALIKQCRFVKIPHHSSPTADKLMSYLPTELDAICTTVFKWGKSNLPNESVIQQYHQFNADIYSTNSHLGSTYPIGIIEYDYDFSRSLPLPSVSVSGNGGRL